jgi:hypothetical protein
LEVHVYFGGFGVLVHVLADPAQEVRCLAGAGEGVDGGGGFDAHYEERVDGEFLDVRR